MMHLYILETYPGLSKLGISKNLDQRLRSYRTANQDLNWYKTWEIGDITRKEGEAIENYIKSIASGIVQIKSECYYCQAEFLTRIVDGALEDFNEVDEERREMKQTAIKYTYAERLDLFKGLTIGLSCDEVAVVLNKRYDNNRTGAAVGAQTKILKHPESHSESYTHNVMELVAAAGVAGYIEFLGGQMSKGSKEETSDRR